MQHDRPCILTIPGQVEVSKNDRMNLHRGGHIRLQSAMDVNNR